MSTHTHQVDCTMIARYINAAKDMRDARDRYQTSIEELRLAAEDIAYMAVTSGLSHRSISGKLADMCCHAAMAVGDKS